MMLRKDERRKNPLQLLSIILAFCFCRAATSFQVMSKKRPAFRLQNESRLHSASGGNEDVVTEKGDELDELSRPSISFTRNSIVSRSCIARVIALLEYSQYSSLQLFDEDAPTQRDNGPLRVWKSTKSFLPALVTGAWGDEGKGDRKPLEHLYNMVFIRIPAVLMAFVYGKNLVDGHGLIISLGGSFGEVPPIIVFAVFAIILR